MHPLDALRTYALLGIPAGLALGMFLGLVARHEGGWGGYASFPRRAARLGHIAAVMLPVLAGAYALWLDGPSVAAGPLRWATVLWIGGGPLLSVSLFLAAWRPRARAAMVVPAIALTAASILFAWAGLA